jgi:transcriptional regulator with XRE-family HTH domain
VRPFNNRTMPNPVHDPKYAIFRDMLVAARLQRKLMQSQVADQLGKNQSFVSKYERGERRLDLPEFVEIAEVLGLDIASFITQYKALVDIQRAAR